MKEKKVVPAESAHVPELRGSDQGGEQTVALAPASVDPQAIIMKALEVNPTPELLREMLEVEKEWRAEMAKRAFVAAMAKFKQECPSVLAKTATANFQASSGPVQYKWTPLEVIIEIVTPHLARNDLSVKWQERQSDGVVMSTCIVKHALGHSEENSLAARPKPNKLLSPAQEVATAVTSLRRYTLLGALGLATAEMDDAEGSSKGRGRKQPKPTKAQVDQLKQLATEEMLTPEQRSRAGQVAGWAERGQRIDVQPVIDELVDAYNKVAEPPEPK